MKFKNELLSKYMVRKNKREKTIFIEWVQKLLKDRGYEVNVEKGLGVRNIVIGDVEKAKIIFTAHYDTCATMIIPNFITPTNTLVFILYQILVMIIMLGIPSLVCFILGVAVPGFENYALEFWEALLLIELFLMLFGPANKKTVNDNTSGVLTILNIIDRLPDSLRDKACFVLFDLEETGLIGSSSFASKYKNAMKSKLLVNFDCVSDGDKMLFILNKKTLDYANLFEEVYSKDNDVISQVVTKGAVYPSDQANFPCGVAVCSVIRGKYFDYIDKIHTKKDTVLREENIKYLIDKSIELVERMK